MDQESQLKAILEEFPSAVQDGSDLTDKRLDLLISLGMPSDVDRARYIVKDCELYGSRYKGYSIEFFGIKGSVDDEPGKTPLILPIHHEENGEQDYLMHVWLQRVRREGMKSVLEEIWSPTEGWVLLAVSTPNIPDKERIEGLRSLVSGLLIAKQMKRRSSVYTLEEFKQDADLALKRMAAAPRRTGKKHQRRSPHGFNVRYFASLIDRSPQTVYDFFDKEPRLRKDLEERLKALRHEKE
jgi:hypothetical protein